MNQSLVLEGETTAGRPSLRSAWAGGWHAIIDGSTGRSLAALFSVVRAAAASSLRDDDDEELALVEDPRRSRPESREALEQALGRRGASSSKSRGCSRSRKKWKSGSGGVETKHGPRLFQTHLDDWPRVLPKGGLLIRDVAGDLYLLAAPHDLDKRSRELLWAFVD